MVSLSSVCVIILSIDTMGPDLSAAFGNVIQQVYLKLLL